MRQLKLEDVEAQIIEAFEQGDKPPVALLANLVIDVNRQANALERIAAALEARSSFKAPAV
jgi:hypothetical protein